LRICDVPSALAMNWARVGHHLDLMFMGHADGVGLRAGTLGSATRPGVAGVDPLPAKPPRSPLFGVTPSEARRIIERRHRRSTAPRP
jgi:hypothetical protein